MLRQWFQPMFWLALSATSLLAMPAAVRTPVTTVVYVSSAESNEIHVFRLDLVTGALTLIETTAIPGIKKAGMSTPLALSPDRRFLYVATRGEPQAVHTFSIDARSGKLQFIGAGPLADSMPYIATDRSGGYLFAASYPGSKFTVSPIGADHVVGATQQLLPNQTNAHSIMADPKNRYVLGATLGNELINVFRFDAKTGKLEPNAPPAVAVKLAGKAKAGPRHFVFHPNGKLVYVLGELDASLHVFDWDARKGELKEKQAISGLPPGIVERVAAADVHLTPNGKFVYMTERGTNSLTGFKINAADGTLTLIETVFTEAAPRSFAIDSTGRYLFVAGQRSHQLASYRIDANTGKLTKLQTYAVGKNPNWIEVVDLPAK